MRLPEPISAGLLPGAAGGAAGGLVFGAAMLDLGSLPSVASIVRVESEAAGFAVNMAIAATVGSGLGLLVWHQRPGLGETLLWGMAYGTLWWFIGTLTLHPLILGDGVRWDAESAQAGLPALLGHILFGATAGLTIVLARLGSVYRQQMARTSLWALVRGGLAGVLAVWMAGAVLAAQGQLHLFVAATPDDARALVWLMTVLVGLLAGIVFALLYPRPTESAGAGLIRGAMYGFLWWVVAPLSVLPALEGSELPWHLEEVREVFQTLPAYLLFGAAMSVFYQWLGVLARLLFSDVVAGADQEGIGTQGLLALARGLVAGFVGGLVFTGIMVKTGALGDVAGLAGMSSPVSGFVVHLVIANIVGASYGLLFRGQSYDIGSALGWGLTYGFLWWIIGTLTLMPVLLGSTPVWTAEVAAGVFPFLIGHLGYGAGLGITFYLLEARYSPWWIPRRQAEVALVARRKEQVMTSAPALWTLVVVISLTLPVLLGSGDIPPVQESIY
ncbi:MAG: hypothetical protein IH956_02090 [Chloroflexi bacterium]|nr:hypothetical protein [Chloroflexota bacterium]